VAAGGTARIAIVHVLTPSEELADPYYVGVRLGIEHRCRELKLDVVKVPVQDAMENPELIANVAGIIAVGIGADHMVAWLRQRAVPLVFADVAPNLDQHDRVESDLQEATRQLLEELYAQGYRRIAFVAGNDRKTGEGCDLPDRRLVSFRTWAVGKGVFDPDLMLEGRLCFETGYEATKHLLDRDEPPELILCANDNVAIGAYRAINEKKLSIPRDIGVVGYNDIPAAQFLSPPLTTVKIHSERIGEAAVDLMAEQLGGRDYFKRLFISTELIWRESCRKATTD
jgi:LacI family transcriptional regulator